MAKPKLEIYSQQINKIIHQKLIKNDLYHMIIQGCSGRQITGEFLRCICVPSIKGGKMDASGNFIMESKEDFHTVQDGYLIIYMALQKKSMI